MCTVTACVVEKPVHLYLWANEYMIKTIQIITEYDVDAKTNSVAKLFIAI